MIHRLRPRIQQIVDALLDDATGKSEIEFMTKVSLENAGRGSRVAAESQFSWFEETASLVVGALEQLALTIGLAIHDTPLVSGRHTPVQSE